MTEQAPYGFRVLDDAREPRRLVDAAAAFSAHAADDPKAETYRTCYLSEFQFTDEFREYLEANDTPKGYDGLCGARWLWVDLDDSNIGDALAAARRLVAFIEERYELDGNELLLFFSGSKGFHIGISLSLFGHPEPSRKFNRVCRRLAEALAAQTSVTIDSGIYDKVRLFRAPNSRHQKTGLRKRRLTLHELINLDAEQILELARGPLAFDVPSDPPVNETARQDWLGAVAELQKQTTAFSERQKRAVGAGRLNHATLEFICDGAERGNRHRSLFAAAANLAEFGCPPTLAHALLTEAGLDSGLPPSEVRRQIDCGIAHVAQKAVDDDQADEVAEHTSARSEGAADSCKAAGNESLPAELSTLWQRERRVMP